MTATPAEPIVVSSHGELTIKEAPTLRDSLLAAIRAGGHVVVLDLSDVTFVDQSAMGVIIGARARLRRSGGDLRLAGLQPKVTRMIELVGGNLPIYPSVAAALTDPLSP
ncbi:MAG: anti-sigma factor antagonist [Actinomycetota bacterium]|jgi:anti-anti-sigma factor|nr:anti-sigma factor antagonist [Actinomycetota bacterium]